MWIKTDKMVKEFIRVLKNAHKENWKSSQYDEGWDDAVDLLEVEFERIFGVSEKKTECHDQQ